MKFNLDKTLIACGFIGPMIFFLGVYFLFHLFYPGYDWINQSISEQGARNSPIQIITNVFGFSFFGIFIMLFALGLFRSKEINAFGKLGVFFIFVTGILMYLTGIFYGNITAETYSILDKLHNIASNYQFPILALGFVIFVFSVSEHQKLRWMTPIILVLGLASLGLAYVFFFTHPDEITYRGVWQRAAIGLPYVIVMIIAIGMYKVQFWK